MRPAGPAGHEWDCLCPDCQWPEAMAEHDRRLARADRRARLLRIIPRRRRRRWPPTFGGSAPLETTWWSWLGRVWRERTTELDL